MSGNDREPIGRKGKPLPPRSSAGRGRRRDIEQDIDQDDFNDDEEEAPVPRKGKGGKPPRGKRRWLGLNECDYNRHSVYMYFGDRLSALRYLYDGQSIKNQ